MNSYQLIFKLRKLRGDRCLSTAAQALYHELVAICNETKWKDVFFVCSSVLCDTLAMSDNTLRKSRNSLVDAGLLFYKASKDKRVGCYYSFVKNLEDDAVFLECLSSLSSSEFADDNEDFPSISSAEFEDDKEVTSAISSAKFEDDMQITPIKRINKTINEESLTHMRENPLHDKTSLSRKRIGDEKALSYPFTSAGFMSAWETLRATPKWKKKLNYALQLSLDKLGRFEEEFAIRQMQRATESNWTGVVFTGTERDYQQWLNQKYANNQQCANNQQYGNNQQYANNQHNRASGQNVGLRSAGIKSISFG